MADHVSRWAYFLVLAIGHDQAVVEESKGFNIDVMSGTSDFEKSKSLVFNGETEEVSVPIPADCTPHPIPTTPLRRQMLGVIEKTIAVQLESLEKNKFKPGSKVKIVISDFDPDYPRVYVFVPKTGDMFVVSLRDMSDPFGDGAISKGEYRSGLEYNKHWIGILKKKLAKFGIVREIEIGGVKERFK